MGVQESAGVELIGVRIADGDDSEEKMKRSHKERVTVTTYGGSLTRYYLHTGGVEFDGNSRRRSQDERVDLKLRTRWEPASVTMPEGDSEKVETKIERRGSIKVFQLTAGEEGVGTRGEQGSRIDKRDVRRCGGIATHITGAQWFTIGKMGGESRRFRGSGTEDVNRERHGISEKVVSFD